MLVEADQCSGVKAWDMADDWTTYKAGDLRSNSGSLWSCRTPAWCSYAPGGSNSSLGWDDKGMCSGGTGGTGAGGSGGSGATGSAGKGGSIGSGGATGTCGSGSGSSTGAAGRGGATGSGGAGGRGGTAGSTGSGGAGGCVLDTMLPAGQSTFNAMFQPPWQGHVASPALSYQGLCQALTKPGLDQFARGGDADQNKREVAAFFAQVAKETAFIEKAVQDGTVRGSTEWGRGALQLTHSFNYQAAGQFLGMDLVANPDIVGTDPVIAWATGLWFWMKYHNTNAGTDPTCHDLILMGSFGETTRKINSISCGNADATTRGSYYQSNCMKLSVTVGGATGC